MFINFTSTNYLQKNLYIYRMNILDIIIGLFLAWQLYRGFSKGFIAAVVSLLGLIAGLYCSLHFSDWVGKQLFAESQMGEGSIVLLSFAITFVAALVGVYFIGKLVSGLIKTLQLNLINKIAGAAFGGLKAVLILSVLFGFITKINQDHWLVKEKIFTQSTLYNPVNETSDLIFPIITDFYHAFLDEYLPQTSDEEVTHKS